MVIIPGRYERVLISRSTSMKVEVSKRPNGLGADAQRIPRVVLLGRLDLVRWSLELIE